MLVVLLTVYKGNLVCLRHPFCTSGIYWMQKFSKEWLLFCNLFSRNILMAPRKLTAEQVSELIMTDEAEVEGG